jgi:hypothetical protein
MTEQPYNVWIDSQTGEINGIFLETGTFNMIIAVNDGQSNLGYDTQTINIQVNP